MTAVNKVDRVAVGDWMARGKTSAAISLFAPPSALLKKLCRAHSDDGVSLPRHSQFPAADVSSESRNGIADQRFHIWPEDFAGERHGSKQTVNECRRVNCVNPQA